MDTTSSDVDKYIDSMLNSFRKKHHRNDVEEYLLIRKRIDKVKNYKRRNDLQSLLALDGTQINNIRTSYKMKCSSLKNT